MADCVAPGEAVGGAPGVAVGGASAVEVGGASGVVDRGVSGVADLAAPAVAEMAAITAAMVRLTALAGDAASWTGDRRSEVLGMLDRAVDGIAAVRAAVLVAQREAGTWRGAGDRSFEAWRARTCRSGERSAAAQVRQAEQLTAVPAVAEAVTEGRISLEHATSIAKVASTGTPAQQAVARGAAGQEELLALAEELDAGTFATTVARWAATIDPDALEADHQAQRRERFLTMADTPRGTFVKGRLDRMAGHRLTLALEALSPRPAEGDDRDPGQRRADALEAMATRILASPDTKPGGHVPPQVSLILTEETWIAARAHRDRQRVEAREAAARPSAGATLPATHGGPVDRPTGAHGGGADRPPGAHGGGADSPPGAHGGGAGYPPATLEDGTPVSVSEVARVMCDCAVTRIAIDADAVPLDLGRTRRLFTGEQRRAILARDRECIWPTCHAPARWTEVHHIDWWDRDDGPTSVDNGAAMCTFHHHEAHRRDLIITRVVLPGAGRRGGARPSRALALVAYEFRDRAGRLIGESVVPPPSSRGERSSAGQPTRPPGAAREASVGPRGGGSAAPRGTPGDQRHDGRDAGGGGVGDALVWATDPVTGMRVPAFFLPGQEGG